MNKELFVNEEHWFLCVLMQKIIFKEGLVEIGNAIEWTQEMFSINTSQIHFMMIPV